MKKLLTLLFLAYSGLAIGQLNLSRSEKYCFLVGTLSDYMGHQQTFTATTDSSSFQFVDMYSGEQEAIVSIIDSLFRDEHKDMQIVTVRKNQLIRLHSKSLSAVIDGYYDYKPSRSWTLVGDTIYAGYLKPDRFSTEMEKLCFLAGAYLRDGGKTDANEYYFRMYNSVSKAKLCVDLLKELNCSNVKFVTFKNRIPVGNWVSFVPSENVMEAIKEVERVTKKKPFSSDMLKRILESE